MTQNTRTDIHRPAEMDPANYELVEVIDNNPEMGPGWVAELGDWGMSLAHRIAESTHADRGVFQCHHCGARIRYAALMEHTPTGELIAVGETCLDNRFTLESKAQFDRLRKAAQLDRQKQRIKTAARAYVADLQMTDDPIARRLGLAMDRDAASDEALALMLKPGWALSTFMDIRRKVWDTYGAPTDRQQDLLIRLLDEGETFHAEQVAKAEAPVEVKVAAPLGRVDFEGEVVFRKDYHSEYGTTWKIILKVTEDEGSWSVFVTEPRSIATSKGDIVRMRATLKPGRSEHEVKGSRPSNAEIIGNVSSDQPDSLA